MRFQTVSGANTNTEVSLPTASSEFAAIVLAAGHSTRMNSATSKVLHEIAGRSLLGHVLASVSELKASRIVVVAGAGQDDVAALAISEKAEVAIQDPPRGTGHAVLQAREALKDFGGDILVVYGDTPLMRPETLQSMIDRRHESDDPAVVVFGFRPADPALYGRLIVDGDDHLTRIVEARDANAEEKAVDLCNGGVMVLDGTVAFDLLAAIGNDNAKGEYYLTDIIAEAGKMGRVSAVVEGDEQEVMGVDHRSALAAAEAALQDRLRAKAMTAGATMVDPGTVWFSADTIVGRDTRIEPNVFFGPGVVVADNVTIKAFSHIEGATIASGAVIGPFARLRPGADLGEDTRVGNFVEIKKAKVEAGAKVNHLSYIGDARIGEKANIGAGTITCNYDGFNKSHTDIGAGAFIGSNSALVAPVSIGDGATVGAGSTISNDVPENDLAVTRVSQKNLPGAAERLRKRYKAAKESRQKNDKQDNTKEGK
ncbi:MAG: bifunctional UDP-N-acetylglucosamine diphosphorylase/glucosamine-1-phosphate N-acetyltransferase GlmU [Alphaproteobacteria bacterium]|jgi:bifunctional UDP-N-acetylglucosamine pyrophosphorylase / glucosamine-1-phosphate N-acetyltransferase|nr:bifunctional UDP-N-acetylglucosamine diphosphorylase/glucosamine-1-phosphate N-acetyltransferase GlmU [Alphaproteobacteria bacterium]MBT4086241.1 bifunctional UDP-N-acetylglucosamine diphosphorylase/glucosamine-1-phosphate N-acetyltransferase GlmU [Alphaproteobacteria bacterium]MBT4543858.1 bifunctional UDP-N-acetylglucosamine diphosphorylase/glucosamine-1-phosphate N-acetyltransferase GlmU [Alphaproteobacteria bacterium]MBT7744869.1 bifunctional UDP-N-acetylglucosamine diphosphorylase/glucos